MLSVPAPTEPLAEFPPLRELPPVAEPARPPAPSASERPSLSEDDWRTISRSVLGMAVAELKQMRWPGWDNPFAVRLSPSYAERMLPAYYSRVGAANVRDLLGVEERVNLWPGQAVEAPWAGAPVPRAYRSVDEADADIRLIAANAATFNGSGHPVAELGRKLLAKWEGWLPGLRRSWQQHEQDAVARLARQ
ncbi:hypothetical protein FNF27_06203 [Cafeteria roenbergensis]|nr:hypothetical protein FNF31_06764 [Cafeteria roenbergensis]KAA0152446.1 hypothetical protein FNF28_07033 [Cafeteria roenbergensis]KAA0171934.1 hypothetical protein FNF27_06203 [Cafeteria roenbergensis]